MKKTLTFIRKHALAILVVAIALAVPFGVASAKYTTTAQVSDQVSVTVEEPAQYVNLASNIGDYLSDLDDATSISFVKGNAVPSTATCISSAKNGVQESGDTKIGIFQNGTDYYVAPMGSDSKPLSGNIVMRAPEDCEGLFYNITNVSSIDCTNLNTSRVTSMDSMFYYCENLTTLNISGFDTSNVTNMNYMFAYCTKLQTLNLSNFNTSQVTTMENMFQGNAAMTSVNVSSFDTSNVEVMTAMFSYCGLLELDLTNFDTSKVDEIYNMFDGSQQLKTIYVSSKFVCNDTEAVMFAGCTSLEGGEGTKFVEGNNSGIYARIDGGDSSPGYFTAKSA